MNLKCLKKNNKANDDLEFQIEGHVDPDYLEIEEMVRQQYRDSNDDHSQLVIYVGGKVVVDIWGAPAFQDPRLNLFVQLPVVGKWFIPREDTRGAKPFGPNSLVNIFSSGKSVAAILMGIMQDQGRFQYDDPISKHWPEFAKNDKHQVKIEDLMRHEAGLSQLREQVSVEDTQTLAIKANKIGQKFENSTQFFPFNATRCYHAVTRDWISNEIFRRVDPKGRTMGEYLRDLDVDVHISVPQERLDDCFDFQVWTKSRLFKNLLMGRFGLNIFQTLWVLINFIYARLRSSGNQSKPDDVIDMRWGQNDIKFFNSEEQKTGETPSAGSYASARGLAKLASAMANEGGGIMSKEGWQKFHSAPKVEREIIFDQRTIYTVGGAGHFSTRLLGKKSLNLFERDLHGYRDGWYGWKGYGGSLCQWHTELNIGFAYVPANLAPLDFAYARGGLLQKKVVEIIDKLKTKKR